MSWKRKVNATLEGITGYNLTRAERAAREAARRSAPPPAPKVPRAAMLPPRMPDDEIREPGEPGDRLLVAPVFVLSPVRSGSTLLRVMLNSHSQIHAPHELHVRRITVNLATDPVQQAMRALGHTHSDVEHILWDRLLHRELARSGKRVLVEKTPSNVFAYPRLAACWPDARFVFLLRHPLSIATSWHEADPQARPMPEAVRHTFQYMKYLRDAMRDLPGLRLTYEDLTADPEAQTRRICEFLGLDWERGMLEYGGHSHGDFVKGIGDWRDKIRTGTVQPGRPLPGEDEIPEQLVEICRDWGYLSP
ncbi:sulfotransferase [Spongiactinospora sp. TRM90649]|uniref:sulfotransferase family protein n=1 Tax=Spongiactinospora sp. TRM90649 TaxID=3031114 RepID=UPI0023F8D418|nr:sulfotransferase [Spongiactinospora sp. TRM90649]MDF5752023.1 sulfotransferase [Spongiactinospora sp. TRM90649]